MGPMTGEISPDIMFWVVWQKVVRMGIDGSKLAWMGEDGYMIKEGSKNKAKGITNGQKQGIF